MSANDNSGEQKEPTFVYVISVDGVENVVKVGVSTDPHLRLAQLNTGSPFKMRLCCILGPFEKRAAYEVEGESHRRMSQHRANGEWFKVDPMVAEGVIMMCLTEKLISLGVPQDLQGQYLLGISRAIGDHYGVMRDWRAS